MSFRGELDELYGDTAFFLVALFVQLKTAAPVCEIRGQQFGKNR